jgi:hypothetical protein
MTKQVDALRRAATIGKANHIGELFAVTAFLNPVKRASIGDSGLVGQRTQRSRRPLKDVTVLSERDQSVQSTERFQFPANNLRKKERFI